MGFQITTPTAIPVDGDGSQNVATWGESGGPYVVPPNEDTGIGSVALTSNDVNYEWQHQSRWIRATTSRMAFSDEGILATCILAQGTWNTGGGTLNVTLTPTRLVADVDGDGGTVLEVKAPVGSPEVLAANTDNYVDFDEAGNYAIASVPNGDPEPAVTANHVRVYKLVTDATELVSADPYTGVAPYPCLGPTIGIVALTAGSLLISGDLDVGGMLGVTGAAQFDDDVTVVGETNTGVTNTGALQSSSIVSTSTITATGVITCAGIQGTGPAAVSLVEGATIAANKTISGDSTTSIASGDVTATDRIEAGTGFQGAAGSIALFPIGIDVSAAQPTNLRGTVSVIGADGGSLTSDGTASLTWNGAIVANGRLRVGTVGTAEGDVYSSSTRLRYNDGTDNLHVHASEAGYVKGYGQANAPADADPVNVDIDNAVAPRVAADLDVVASFWCQRAVAGSVTISLNEVGGIGQISTSATLDVPATGSGDYAIVTFPRRRVAADTTPRIYRLTVAGGGQNVSLTNVRIAVTVAESL